MRLLHFLSLQTQREDKTIAKKIEQKRNYSYIIERSQDSVIVKQLKKQLFIFICLISLNSDEIGNCRLFNCLAFQFI